MMTYHDEYPDDQDMNKQRILLNIKQRILIIQQANETGPLNLTRFKWHGPTQTYWSI